MSEVQGVADLFNINIEEVRNMQSYKCNKQSQVYGAVRVFFDQTLPL